MKKDPTAFRERFKRWKSGELVYSAGLPTYDTGKLPGYNLLDVPQDVLDKTQIDTNAFPDWESMQNYIRNVKWNLNYGKDEFYTNPVTGNKIDFVLPEVTVTADAKTKIAKQAAKRDFETVVNEGYQTLDFINKMHEGQDKAAEALFDIGNYATMIANPIETVKGLINMYKMFRHPINTFKSIKLLINPFFKNSNSNVTSNNFIQKRLTGILNPSELELLQSDHSILEQLYDKSSGEVLLYINEHPEFAKLYLLAKAGAYPSFGDDPNLRNDIKEILEFYKNDVYPRINNADSDAGTIGHLSVRDRLWNNHPGLDNSNVYIYDIPNKNAWGFADGEDTYILNPDGFPNKPVKEVITHEFRHNVGNWIRKMYNNGRGLFGYTTQEEFALNEGYKFTKEFEDGSFFPIKEKAATNTELRYRLHQIFSKLAGRPIYGTELDKMIYDMNADELLNRLSNLNGYGQNIVENLNKTLANHFDDETILWYKKAIAAEKIKYALKYVGMSTGTAYLTKKK